LACSSGSDVHHTLILFLDGMNDPVVASERLVIRPVVLAASVNVLTMSTVHPCHKGNLCNTIICRLPIWRGISAS
jgi:hypothetical protein